MPTFHVGPRSLEDKLRQSEEALAKAQKTIIEQKEREVELRKLLELNVGTGADNDTICSPLVDDAKTQALTSLHTQKVRTLMRSIHQLQDQVTVMKSQDKEHRRSALIQSLRKKQQEQELIMDILKETLQRKVEDFHDSMEEVNKYIVKKISNGAKRVRPKLREELELEFSELDKKYKGALVKLKAAKSKEELRTPVPTAKSCDEREEDSDSELIGMQAKLTELQLTLCTKDKLLAEQMANLAQLRTQVDGLRAAQVDADRYKAKYHASKVAGKKLEEDLIRIIQDKERECEMRQNAEAQLSFIKDAHAMANETERSTLWAQLQTAQNQNDELKQTMQKKEQEWAIDRATIMTQMQTQAKLVESIEAQSKLFADEICKLNDERDSLKLAFAEATQTVNGFKTQSPVPSNEASNVSKEHELQQVIDEKAMKLKTLEKQITASKLLARQHKKEKEQMLMEMNKLRTLVASTAPATEVSHLAMSNYHDDELAHEVPLLLEEVDEIELENSNSSTDSTSFVERYITSKMQPGSVKGSMFTMTVSIVGAGVLALPYALEEVGLVMGIVFVVAGGWLAYFSLYLLVACSDLTKAMSYMHLAKLVAGKRLAHFVQLVISLNLFGTSVGYIVASSELILLVVKPHGDHASPDEKLQSRNALIGSLCLCFVLPLSLLRSLSSLRFSSLFSLLCIVFLTMTVVVKYFQFVHLGYAKDIVYQWNHLPLFTLDMRRILKALPLVIFAYTCHPNVLPIYFQLQRRSSPRMYKVARRSLGVATSLYVLLVAFVFLTFGMSTRTNFLQNNYHNDPAIIVGSLFFAVALVMTTPLYIHTLRNGLNETLWGTSEGNLIYHATITIVLVGSVCGVAIAAKDIASVLGILGSTTNPIICFALPSLYICKLAPDAYWMEKGGAVLVCVITCSLCIASLVEQFRGVAF